MKILIAVLMSILVTAAIPVTVKNCSGNSFLNIRQNIFSAVNPLEVTMAYATLLDSLHRSCVVAEKKTYVVHKWQDASGAWHYADATQDGQQTDNTSLPVDPELYKTNASEAPRVEAWLPYAIIGFSFGMCSIFYLLMMALEAGWQYFHKEDEEGEAEATVYHERKTTGESVEFFSKSPYEILGINPRASFAEVEAAYERQLSHHHKTGRHNTDSKTLADQRQKLLMLHQAYEAIKRKNDDKFLAAT